MVITISGVSGVGKTTVARLMEYIGFHKIVTYTSRPPRPEEVDGVDYHFSSRSEMLGWRNIGALWEVEEYFGNLYGSPEVDTKENYVAVVEVKGALNYKKHYGSACCTVLLTASYEEIAARMHNRSDASVTSSARKSEVPLDSSLFDVVIDTSGKTPEHIVYELQRSILTA